MIYLMRISYFSLAVLFCSAPPAKGEVITTATVVKGIVYATEIMAVLSSLHDTGANPTGTITLQNRELLLHLHDRLERQEANLAGLHTKLDLMPERVRSQLKGVFVDERIVAIRSHMRVVLDDIKVIANNAIPVADASLRLHGLQIANANLIQAEDDLIILEMIPAMYVEWALIAMQGIEADEKQNELNIRLAAYKDRLQQVFDPGRNGSAHKVLERINIDAGASITLLTKDFDSVSPYVQTEFRKITNCEAEASYSISTRLIQFRENLEDKWHAVFLDYDSLRSVYMYLIDVAQYEYLVLSGQHHEREYPRVRAVSMYFNRYKALHQKVSVPFRLPEYTEFLFFDPPSHHVGCM